MPLIRDGMVPGHTSTGSTRPGHVIAERTLAHEHQLSGTDSVFLAVETPNWHQHVAGLVILDPTDAPEFSFDALRDTIAARIHLVPKLRWKLATVPFGIDRPIWVDDEDFHLDDHLSRVTVETPGEPQQVTAAVAGMLSTQLDRSRPLWEIIYVDGIVNGRVAIAMKYHHCLLDGMAGAQMATLLLDLEPSPAQPPPSVEEAPPPKAPTVTPPSLFAHGLTSIGTTMLNGFRFGGRLVRRGVDVGLHMFRSTERPDLAAVVRAPRTSFNRSIGPNRALAFASVSLDDVKAIRRHYEVKVNDVILALSAGALRHYLAHHGELPERPLTSGIPVSMRADGDMSMDNQISMFAISLATDVEDPVERLLAIARSTRTAKALGEVMAERPIGSFGLTAPPFVLDALARFAANARVMAWAPAVMNTVISNVPGPPIPLYLAGARLVGIYSASVLFDAMGVNITCFTFEDRIDFGIHVDPDLVPDPWAIAEQIPKALAELMAAADLGEPGEVADPFGLTTVTSKKAASKKATSKKASSKDSPSSKKAPSKKASSKKASSNKASSNKAASTNPQRDKAKTGSPTQEKAPKKVG